MTIIQGIVGSQGFGSGTAIVKRTAMDAPKRLKIKDLDNERKRFRTAQSICAERFNKLIDDSMSLGEETVEIFKAYLTILRDEAFFQKALSRMEAELVNIEYLIYDECKSVMEKFADMEDPYLRERSVDIENVCNDLIRTMLGLEQDFTISRSMKDVIIVADDLTPVETMKMDKKSLRGFVTEKGGATSHTVILAKALGIPAIIGVADLVETVSDGDFLLLDAFSGTVSINPDAENEAKFNTLSAAYSKKQNLYAENVGQPAVTKDGFALHVNVNTGDETSIKDFDVRRCDGVGLLRTEFLYMNRSGYPDEDTQFTVYSNIAAKAAGKEVIIRTLDIGGDKQADYMGLPVEDNPFLGCRAIRLCLDRRDVFHTQLRAILRASVHGNVKIMFPMIVNIEELLEAKECVEDAKRTLRDEGIAFNENIPIGIMVETPAAVLISDKLAKESDFFSIGSNDLIQYVTATDRLNKSVQHLYDSCNLSVLNAVQIVADNAQSVGIPWGICGEVASEARLIPMWVALGVSELSVAPSLVGRVKYIIRRLDRAELIPQIEKILNLQVAEDVRRELDNILSLTE